MLLNKLESIFYLVKTLTLLFKFTVLQNIQHLDELLILINEKLKTRIHIPFEKVPRNHSKY